MTAAAVTVFVSDPSAEAERIAQALRASGYTVVDVPLSMLVARVAVQHPRVILLDADSEGALDAIARMRELPDAEGIDVLFVARPEGAIKSNEEALAHEGSGLFVRPVDVPSLVKKVEALTGAPPRSEPPRSKRPSGPPSLPPTSMRASAAMAASIAPETRTSPTPVPRRSSDEPPASAALSLRRLGALAPPVSPELQGMLAEAEQRVSVQGGTESVMPSPEEEIEAVLPAELLASLDEPVEEEEDDDEMHLPGRSASPAISREKTGGGEPSRTGTGRTTGAGSSTTGAGASPAEAAQPVTHGGSTHSGATGAGTTGGGSQRRDLPAAGPMASPAAPPVAPIAPVAVFPAVLAAGEAIRAVARAIASRTTGSMCVASSEAERRVVLREGDVVTAASTAESETLLAFLAERGELPRETVRRLEGKFAPFGRHAGAALVARGYLRQDQMWPTLRAHAEWLLAHVVTAGPSRLAVEAQPPGRLAGEPSVFGGSTGAAVFVEVVRRVIAPEEAVERLGGSASRIGEGASWRLLDECALDASHVGAIRAAQGRSLGELLHAASDGDLATVVFSLEQLGVVETIRAVDGPAEGARDKGSGADAGAIDAEGIRERVRARLQLVEDGDYFAVLGVGRRATGYEVKRAFLELRRAFDPGRLLTPEVADLADDVRKIVSVIEEAYEILRDEARRERYRRAIEETPQ